MKKISTLIASLTTTVSLAVAQDQNYTSYGELTKAALHAANGQLNMIYGGNIGGGLSSTANIQPTTPTTPINSVPQTTHTPTATAQSANDNGKNSWYGLGSESTALDKADNTNLWVAATIGVAALLVPLAISFVIDTD